MRLSRRFRTSPALSLSIKVDRGVSGSLRRLALCALFLAFATVAQAGPPELLEITESRNAAVGYAVTQALTIHELTRACARVPTAAGKIADAEHEWLVRNQDYFEAARGWLEYVKHMVATQEGTEAADAFKARTRDGFRRTAAKLVAKEIAQLPPDEARCSKWADLIYSGQGDLDQELKYLAALKEILAFHRSVAAWYDHSASGDPEDRSSCVEGLNLSDTGRYAEALRAYDACIRDGHLSSATLARTYRNIGITYRSAKQPVKAIAAYDKAIELNPDDVVDDYINRANAYDDANQLEKALADYGQALKLDPGFGQIYYNRGIAYEHNHMPQEAKADFTAAYAYGLRTPLLYERLATYGLLDKAKQ